MTEDEEAAANLAKMAEDRAPLFQIRPQHGPEYVRTIPDYYTCAVCGREFWEWEAIARHFCKEGNVVCLGGSTSEA